MKRPTKHLALKLSYLKQLSTSYVTLLQKSTSILPGRAKARSVTFPDVLLMALCLDCGRWRIIRVLCECQPSCLPCPSTSYFANKRVRYRNVHEYMNRSRPLNFKAGWLWYLNANTNYAIVFWLQRMHYVLQLLQDAERMI